MKKKSLFFLFLIISTTFVYSQTEIIDLSCEYKKDPVGITVQNPRLSWKIISGEMNRGQSAYHIIAASSPRLLTDSRADLWNSGKINSDQNVHIEYKGKDLNSRQKCWWKVRVWDNNGKVTKWSDPAYFEIGLMSKDDWEADWIKTSIEFDEYSYPSPMLRKEFTLEKAVKSARLYATSLGLYQFFLNGEKAGNELFTPGFTTYDERLQYQVYDVTPLVKKGDNAAGIILGNGWYRAFNTNNQGLQDIQDLKALAQIEVEFSDGSKKVIKTDDSWKSSTGAILKSEIFDGEIYDARLEKNGWYLPDYDDTDWRGVTVTNDSKEILTGSISQPVRKTEEIKPIEIIYTPEGDTVLDLGQNMVGWCRLSVDCPAGTTIKLRHAEVLDKEGNFYTKNLRSAKQQVVYTCKGGGTEVYEPHFTFQGFRYVAISGYPKEVNEDILTGIVIHSDLPRTGTFSCNNELINQLQHNIIWGQKGNFLDVPTDCPQRNERLGWTGDAQVFAPTACFNMNCGAFYTKWLKDLAAEQHEDGAVPWVVPNLMGRGDAHGWADAALIVPWKVYLNYNDKRILEEQYESMKGWVDYVKNQAGESYLWKPKSMQFGDWLAYSTNRSDYPGATTDKDLTANAYFYHSADLLSRTASLLGKTDDAAAYNLLKEKVREAFNKEYVTPNGRLSSNTQTAYVVALSFGLLDGKKEEAAAKRLAADVNSFGHITTGFLGTADICHVLTKYGYLDEAYKLLYRKEYPSWLYPVTMDATTIWERWDGIKPDGSFQTPGMNSFNHYAYGAIGDWLYKVVAGINPDPEIPGYKKIIIKPHPGNEMNDVSASHESMYGAIKSEWQIKNNILTLNVEIPSNTSAEIYIPSTSTDFKMNGKISTTGEVLNESGLGYHFIKTEIGSGDYVFETEFEK